MLCERTGNEIRVLFLGSVMDIERNQAAMDVHVCVVWWEY